VTISLKRQRSSFHQTLQLTRWRLSSGHDFGNLILKLTRRGPCFVSYQVSALIGSRRLFQGSETGQTVNSKFETFQNDVSIFRLKLNTFLRIVSTFKNNSQKCCND
jgi:hypothetical protein